MSTKPVPILLVMLLLLSVAPLSEGNANGKYNQSGGCTCHANTGTPAASVSISGHPASYTAGATYTLTVSVTGGVSGSEGGFSLDINKGSLSSGIGFAVSVNGAGTSATHTITGSNQRTWSVDWTAPSTGSGQSTLSVAGLTANGNNQYGGDRWATAVYQIPEAGAAANTAPVATNAILGPNGATTTSTLSLSYTYSDAENDPESGTTIQWFRDDVLLSLTGTTVASSLTSKHQEWYAIITPSDGQDDGANVTSNTLTIANSIPVMNPPSIAPSSPESDDALTFSATASDEDQDTIAYDTRWLLEGVVIAELDNSQTVPSYATRSGENWSMEVRANDGEAVTPWQTSQTVQIGGEIENTAPVASIPAINPATPLTAEDLSFTYSFSDADGDAETRYEIEWYLDGVLDAVFKGAGIPSSSTSKGQSWTAKVRVSDGAAWSPWATSNTVVIGNTAPISTSLAISQETLTTLESATIELTHSDVDGDAMANSQIIWLKDGVREPSLDGSTTLASEQTTKGEVWTVQFKAGDGTLLSENTLAKSIEIVNSAPSIVVELSADPSILNPLNANISTTDVDGDVLTSTINWYRNGFLEASLANQTSVPALLLGPGQVWSVEATVSDGTAIGPTAYQSSTVLNLAPSAQLEQRSVVAWIGETVTFDGLTSSDPDGRIISYSWSWSDINGASGAGVGSTFSFIPSADASVTLTVVDDLGATATENQSITPTAGPIVTQLEASADSQTVELIWSYEGPNATFQIQRNGVILDTVSLQEFSDTPLTAGQTMYTVRPVLEGLALQDGSSASVTIEVTAEAEATSSATSVTGSIVGFFLLLIGVAALGMIVLERRD
jgi:hypothetical protein